MDTEAQEKQENRVQTQETTQEQAPQSQVTPIQTVPEQSTTEQAAANQVLSGQTLTPAKKKKNKLFPIIIGVTAVVVLALTVAGIYAYNTPANRLSRLLELGQRYLDELEYERAAVTFQDALDIEPKCLIAYAGGIEAYIGLDDTSSLQEFYQGAIDTMDGMDDEELAADMELAVEIFVQADNVYPDDIGKAVTVLEQGYERTDHNSQVVDALVGDYGTMAGNCRESGDTDGELDLYDRILDIQPDNENTRRSRSTRVREYLEKLLDEGNLEKAEELIRRYRDVIDDIDFGEYQRRIDTMREEAVARDALLQQVYTLMAAQDYVAMAELDGAEETNAVVATLGGSPGIYAPEGFTADYTGIAAGIYPFREGVYNFYYGEYVNGIRSGQGILFVSSSTYYEISDVPWQNDAPNGNGTVTGYYRQSEEEEYGSYYITVDTGTFTDGLYNGEFTKTMQDNYTTGHAFRGAYIADMGRVTDVYDQYPQYHEYAEAARDHQNGKIIYVFLEDISGGTWNNWLWWFYTSPGKTLGISGFEN